MDNNAKQYGNFSVIDGGLSRPKAKKTGGGGGDMEARIAKLEANVESIQATLIDIKSDIKTSKGDISTLKSDTAVIKSNYATKQDIEIIKTEVQKAISTQTKWLMATIFVALGAGITIAKLLF
ncbi:MULTISPECIES: hypothetical protein [Providencia]|uniref:hypothetical protein n=1 Tax=Providencia TaxID=586 RepID=UPI002348EF4F|nr:MULTISPECIES: hypothetical protein [unclassified Providencia]